MANERKYPIFIEKIVIDGEVCFEATVSGLPDVAEYADSYNEAYDLIVDTIETTAKIFDEKSIPFPISLIQ